MRVAPIRLTTLPLTPEHLLRCAPLWGDADHYTPAELDAVLATGARLLRSHCARGRLIVDDTGKLRGFGLTAFLSRAFADDYLRAPSPRIGHQILCAPNPDRLLLDERAMGRANAGDGLDLVVVNQGYELRGLPGDDWHPLLGMMIQAFADTHRGFRLGRLIVEVFGESGIEVTERGGAFQAVHRFEVKTRAGTVLPSAVLVLDREHAERTSSMLLPMFSYSPPRLCFTLPEQHVLRAAVHGVPDPSIAATLGIPLTAVKARWARIQRRAERDLELRETLSPLRGEGRRGGQSRHVILDFVRNNPSELTPFETSGHRTG